ncbi:MAG TPA: hypothetical protein VLA49_04030 [Anaerolineales bacterium]|nr:hypothetical protein [Anaerolineales bacterium]
MRFKLGSSDIQVTLQAASLLEFRNKLTMTIRTQEWRCILSLLVALEREPRRVVVRKFLHFNYSQSCLSTDVLGMAMYAFEALALSEHYGMEALHILQQVGMAHQAAI